MMYVHRSGLIRLDQPAAVCPIYSYGEKTLPGKKSLVNLGRLLYNGELNLKLIVKQGVTIWLLVIIKSVHF